MLLILLFGWLSEHSQGSVLPALTLHTAVNGWGWVTPGLLAGGNPTQVTRALGMLALLSAGLLIRPPGRDSRCSP